MLSILIATTLGAATPDVPRAINGQIIETHEILGTEFVKLEPTIKLVFYPSRDALNKAYEKRYNVKNADIFGFATPHEGSVCEIHIVDPRVDYQAALLGHELLHCAFGTWHNPWMGQPPLKKKK